MTNQKDNDPSMDDILASIRKIISDDEARAQSSGQPAADTARTVTPPSFTGASPAPESRVEPRLDLRPSAAPRTGVPGSREDVLLLTDLIEEPPPLPASRPAPAQVVPLSPRIDPARASEMPQPTVDPTPAPKPAAPESPSTPPASDQPLVGSNVVGATTQAFERLNQAVQETTARPAAPDPGPALGTAGKTIEDLVKDMLRPMLKDWLDKNLPPIVERIVEREVARLTRR